jgi:hypothetical protein
MNACPETGNTWLYFLSMADEISARTSEPARAPGRSTLPSTLACLKEDNGLPANILATIKLAGDGVRPPDLVDRCWRR